MKRQSTIKILLAFSLGIAVLLPAMAWGPVLDTVQAATISVGCTGGVGDVADLISSINTANSNPGPDTLTLGANCVYTLTSEDNTEFGHNALPAITSDITIEGNGGTIQRGGSTTIRIFYVAPGGALTLSDLVLANGLAKGLWGGRGDEDPWGNPGMDSPDGMGGGGGGGMIGGGWDADDYWGGFGGASTGGKGGNGAYTGAGGGAAEDGARGGFAL